LTAFAPLAGFVLMTISLAVWRRKLGAVPLVAMIYAGAISAMAIVAMWLPWAGWPAMIGAVSFLASDLILAAELFRLPPDASARRWTAPVVWWTYVAAQALIICGVINVVQARG
ncbi:MAG: lysoplasmalogenase family protein, partial [Terricaulis sp.]